MRTQSAVKRTLFKQIGPSLATPGLDLESCRERKYCRRVKQNDSGQDLMHMGDGDSLADTVSDPLIDCTAHRELPGRRGWSDPKAFLSVRAAQPGAADE